MVDTDAYISKIDVTGPNRYIFNWLKFTSVVLNFDNTKLFEICDRNTIFFDENSLPFLSIELSQFAYEITDKIFV